MIKTNNLGGLRPCDCGDYTSKTLAYFLENDGYDVEEACNELGISPYVEICEGCYRDLRAELDPTFDFPSRKPGFDLDIDLDECDKVRESITHFTPKKVKHWKGKQPFNGYQLIVEVSD